MDTCTKNVSRDVKTPRDVKTRALVLKRTNYGEADRIVNLITPEGKVSVMAKGVRKPRSKLAGGVEMFTLSEVNLHFGKGDLAVLTGAKMVRFYGEIMKDLSMMEMASGFLKEINRASEMVDSAEFFEILDKCLIALNQRSNMKVVEAWFMLNLARAMGEQINLYTDVSGEKLRTDLKYRWDDLEMGLCACNDGPIDVDAIKLMRLMWTMDLAVVCRVKNADKYMPEILKIAYAVKKVVK